MRSPSKPPWQMKLTMLTLAALSVEAVPSLAHAQLDRGEVRIFAIVGFGLQRVDPIAVVTDSIWRNPISGTEDEVLAEWGAYYAARPRLYLFARNGRVGRGIAAPASTPQFCFDITGQLRWEAARASVSPPAMVAVTDSLFGGRRLARPPVYRERRALWDAIATVAADNGVPDSLIERFTPAGAPLTVLTPEGEPRALVGGVAARGMGLNELGLRRERLVAVFVILRANGEAMEVQLDWTNDAVGDGVMSWWLVDVMDLTRDGTPELLIQNSGYEGWHYEILDEVGGEWEVIHRGGGGGC
jgi:hypothetical protein